MCNCPIRSDRLSMANKSQQPDAPVATLEHQTSSFERFLEENLKTLLIAGGVIFVGIIGYVIFTYISESKAADQANAFTGAESVEDYREVINTYPGSLAAGNAQLMIGKTLAEDDEKKSEASAELRTFVESYADHPQRSQGMFLLASLLLEEDKKSEAIEQFDKVIAEYPDSHLSPYAKLFKGDFAYEEGNIDAAQKIYSQVLMQHTGTEAAKLAEQRADQAKLDAPEIVAPRPEPVTEDSGPPAPGVGAPTPFILDPAGVEGQSEGGDEEVEANDADADADADADTPVEPDTPVEDAPAAE